MAVFDGGSSPRTVRRPQSSDWLHERGGWHIQAAGEVGRDVCLGVSGASFLVVCSFLFVCFVFLLASLLD